MRSAHFGVVVFALIVAPGACRIIEKSAAVQAHCRAIGGTLIHQRYAVDICLGRDGRVSTPTTMPEQKEQ